MNNFPIDSKKDEILNALETNDWLIINSSPGSGKTTRVPVFLTEKCHQKIYILEPRKMAAKLASNYVKKAFPHKPLSYVGHIFRFENTTTNDSKIIFLTEGSFLNILKANSNLNNVDVVILDEFHERHLNTDMALAFLKEVKKHNSHLKIIIMSATLDSNKLEEYIDSPPATISLDLKGHEIEIKHLPNDTLVLKESLEKKVLDAITESLSIIGNILVFLPGMLEIRKVKEKINMHFKIEPYILHGDLSPIDFESENFNDLNKKKIILSTNIAESSVTIPGVRIVIDSGLKREASLNPVSRLKNIELKKTSKASAIQRAHRSNREGNGLVFRLYSKQDFDLRNNFDEAEIMRSDLSELIIKTQDIFEKLPEELNFLDGYNQKEYENALTFLNQVSLIKEQKLTEKGKHVSKIPDNPRLATILINASEYGNKVFEETISYIADWTAFTQKEKYKKQIYSLLKISNNDLHVPIEKIFLTGFIDQIAKLRADRDLELIHRDGKIYKLNPSLKSEIDINHELWIILDLDNKNQITKILPIEEEWLYDLEHFPIEEHFKYELVNNKLFKTVANKIGAISLDSNRKSIQTLDKESKLFLLDELGNFFNNLFNESFFIRLLFLERYTNNKLVNFNLENWFYNEIENYIFDGSDFLEQLKTSYFYALFDFLNSDGLFNLDHDLPLQIQLSDKRKSNIIYDFNNGVFVESYIQDFYGLNQMPKILKGNENLTIRLLGPHKRPIQVTNDLNSFWNKAYKEMFNELKRDYPKHYWPLDPKTARPILLLKNVTTPK